MDSFSNRIKVIIHGFFLSIGFTLAEPATILPLIVNYFGGSSVVVGLFSALLRGGAVVFQLYAAFHAQSYKIVLPYQRRVFLFRFLGWFFIGACILLFGKEHNYLTLSLIGVGLFIFSASAGFGAIYYQELMGKIFTHNYRGKTMAYRQFFSALASLLSGVVAGIVLDNFQAPNSFGYLFVISAFVMGIGFVSVSLIKEQVKENVSKKEKNFKEFLKNAKKILATDENLQIQVVTYFLAYSYLLSLPFIILDAKSTLELTGKIIGSLITLQMIGAMSGNLLWAKLIGKGLNKLVTNIAIFLMIIVICLAMFANDIEHYFVIFFLFGFSMDGAKLAASNLLLIIAPEDKRAVYIAIFSNITGIGLFFGLLGGVILSWTNYNVLYLVTIFLLSCAFYFSFKLKSEN